MKTGRLFHELSEVLVTGHTMMAMSSKIKVQDSSGKDHRLYDVMEMKDGKMSVKEGYTYNGNPLESESTLNIIRGKMISANNYMQGVYNKLDSPAMTGYIVGKHLAFMRGWLFMPLARRFDRTRYEESLGQFREGNFTTLINIISNTFGNGGFVKNSASAYKMLFSPGKAKEMFLTEKERSELSEREQQDLINHRKSNIRKSWAEISMIVTMYLLSSLAFGDDDDSDRDSLGREFARYHTLRLKRELFFYNPFEMMEIMKNPFISAKVATDLADVSMRLLTLNYGSGFNEENTKGENILVKKISRLTPILNQVRAWEELSRAADAIDQGYR
jgi:hypothetical protein